MSMLEVKDLQVYYGVIQALKGISFHVEQGEVIALIGANGAGKTTTLQTLTGIIPAKAGSIIYEGKNLTKIPAHKIVEMGMAHVPEGRRVFADMSVYENLLMGAYTRKDKEEIDVQTYDTDQIGQRSAEEKLLAGDAVEEVVFSRYHAGDRALYFLWMQKLKKSWSSRTI